MPNELQNLVAALLDAHLLRILKEGGEVMRDRRGCPLLDPQGKPVRVGLSAQMLEVIRKRCKDNGAVGAARSAAASLLLEAARRRGILPPGPIAGVIHDSSRIVPQPAQRA